MYKNNKINDVHETRYIVSWLKAGGDLRYGENYDEFREWLKSLELMDEEIDHVVYLASNGKMELETSAKKFIQSLNR